MPPNNTAVEIAPIYDADFKEYDDEKTIERYRRKTAGEGIDYLLSASYGPIWLRAARDALRDTKAQSLRIVEFGCGAGMAVHYVVEALRKEGVEVELAVGADFVPAMVAAAQQEVEEFGDEWTKQRMRFVVATNEELAGQLAGGLGQSAASLEGSFHLALGVNTFRYPIRHGNGADAARQLESLVMPGGRVVVIDMNDRFPYGIKPKRNPPGTRLPYRFGTAELPSLEGYAAPLRDVGFEIVRKEHFSWIPHSANGLRFRAARAAAPLLDKLVGSRAMRSLVVARRR